MTPTAAEKVTSRHHDRRAYVYVRQSSAKQVQHNRESQRNQYALVERAVMLGWLAERIHVIDTDLGQSGQDGSRQGFQELVSEVSLGRVGIVLAYEASRLARNNADWYTLLDLASVVGTLIGDADGVYDPRSYNDRLLLGLRGMLSEAELHLLRLRLDAGRMRQVERGTYRQQLPTGLVRLADGRVVRDPDERVRGAFALVFARFVALGSCQRVLRSLRDDELLLPRHQTGGLHAGQLIWKKPTDAALYDIVQNPAYAGAFVYGRHGPHPDRRPGQRTRMVHRPMEEWTIHRDAYAAYITWEEYVANQARLRENASRYALRLRGVPRQGNALLVGLVACGCCGRQMRVAYKPQVRYFCNARRKVFADQSCLNVDGASLDTAVTDAFFAAIAPAELDVLDAVLAEQQADRSRLGQQHTDRVRQAEYEARLAQRQYQAVDPDNRLVAAELERRWELALRALTEAREAAERFAQSPGAALDPALRAQLRDVGRHLPALWASGRLSPAQQKELLRSLVRRVVVRRPTPDTLEATVVWVSGAVTPLALHPPIQRTADVGRYEELVVRVAALAADGYTDAAIACRLTAEGFRSARSAAVPKRLVLTTRQAHGQASLFEQFRRQGKVGDYWTVAGLARALNVHRNWLYHRIYAGTLASERHPATGHHLIPDAPDLLDRLRAQLPRARHP